MKHVLLRKPVATIAASLSSAGLALGHPAIPHLIGSPLRRIPATARGFCNVADL